MAPTVSVVVPTYNRADSLSRTVDSVLNQTLGDLELIVVDDASDDDTADVVAAYDDNRLTFLQHDENQGGSAARNTGIEAAVGDYIAFLDSDDVWHPMKLEKQVETLESRSDEWVAAYCGVEMDAGSSPIKRRIADLISRRSQTEGAEGGVELVGPVLSDDFHTSAGSTLIVQSGVVSEIEGFDESFHRFQDPEFLIRVLKQGKLAHVDEPLVEIHDTGVPSADAVRDADVHYRRTFAEDIEYLESQGLDVTGAHHYFLARLYLTEGRFRTGLRYLRSARRPRVRQFPGLALNVVSGVRKHV